MNGYDDVLDVNLSLLRIRLLGEPCKPLLEVLATRLGVACLTIEIL